MNSLTAIYLRLNPAWKKAGLILAVFSVLFGVFAYNIFQTADAKWFNEFAYDSEGVIIARLAATRYEGMTSHGGLLGRYTAETDNDRDPQFFLQVDTYKTGMISAPWVTYAPQIGGQAIVFSIIDQLFSVNVENLLFFNKLTAAITALIVTALISWIGCEIGIAALLCSLIGLIFSPWFIVMSSNIYWVFGTTLLPLVVSAFGFRWLAKRKGAGLTRILVALFFAFFARFCLGYEYISAIGLAAWAPVVFYACRDRWPIKYFVKVTALLLLVSIAAFVAAFAINIGMLMNQQGGGAFEAFRTILGHAEIRLGTPLIDKNFINPSLLENTKSLTASIPSILAVYLRGFMDKPGFSKFFLDWPATYADILFLAFVFSSVVLVRLLYKKEATPTLQKQVGLVAAMWAAFAASISWHILAHQHSFIHPHLNFVLWYLPFMFFFFALFGELIGSLAQFLKEKIYRRLSRQLSKPEVKKPRAPRRSKGSAIGSMRGRKARRRTPRATMRDI